MNVGSESTEGWFRTEPHHPDPGGHLLEVVVIGFLFVSGKGLEDRGGHGGRRAQSRYPTDFSIRRSRDGKGNLFHQGDTPILKSW